MSKNKKYDRTIYQSNDNDNSSSINVTEAPLITYAEEYTRYMITSQSNSTNEPYRSEVYTGSIEQWLAFNSNKHIIFMVKL